MLDLKFKIIDLGKSKMTSGNAYKVIVINKRNNKRITFTFNDNYLNKSTGQDMLMSRVADAIAYSNCEDINEFCCEYYVGIDSFEEAQKVENAYRECEKASKDLKRVFSKEEREELMQEYENF